MEEINWQKEQGAKGKIRKGVYEERERAERRERQRYEGT